MFSKYYDSIINIIIFSFILILMYIFSLIIISLLTTVNYKNNETPPDRFRIVLEHINDQTERDYTCIEFNEYKKYLTDPGFRKSKDAPFVSALKGECGRSASFKVENINDKKQTIKVQYRFEANLVENLYYVTDKKIIPVYLRLLIGPTSIVPSYFTSLIFTALIFRTVKNRIRKKLK